MKSLRVLHLEDVEADALLVEHTLRKGGYDPDVRVESSAQGFQEALDAGSWDIILSDHGMGEFSALDALEVYHARGCEVPFILVSGQIGEEQAAEAMRRGSHDFVSKTRLSRLIPVVTRALEESGHRQQIRHYQQQLEERANQLQTFVEQAPASISMLDADLRIVAVSGRWRADFGFAGVEVKGRTIYEVFPELSQEHRQTLERCLEGNVKRRDAYPFARETGVVQWLRWEVRPWYAEAGRVGGLFVFTEDVTEHIQARSTLQEREWMFTRAEGLAHVGTFYRDLRTGQLTGSEEAYRILGEDSSKILALDDRLTSMVHPEDRDEYLRTRAAVREQGGRHTHTFRILRNGSEERTLRSIAELVRDANGEPQGVIRVIQDVTELTAVEREVRHQQWLLSQAQRLAQVGTLYRDMATGAVTLSDEVGNILGLPDGTPFQGLASYIHPDDAQAFADSTQVLRNQPRQITHEFRILRPDGITRHLNSVADATLDPEGRVTGVLRVIQDVTQQKQANAALREKEWLLNRAQAVGRFGTWFRNLDAHTLSWSDETYNIFGMAPGDQLHFESYSEAILLEDRERFMAERGRITRAGGSFTLEFRIRRPDGEIRTLWMVAERVFASGGRSNGILGIVQDITERKAAETEVREREWVLSRAQEAGQIGMWFWNRLTDRMTVSDETYRILGVTPDQWGHTLDAYRAIIHPEDRGTFEMRRMVKREELGGRFADDYRIIRPDGSVRYVTHVGEFFYDDAGNLKGLIGILQDITDRKRSEAELREKEWMLTRAQEAAHIGTFYRDVHGKFLKWSDETYRIFGVDPATFTPTIDGFMSLVHPEDRTRVSASRQHVFQEAAAVAEELRIVRPDGKVRNVMLTAEVVQNTAGQPAGLMGIVQDITDRKTNEGRLVQAQKLEAMGRLTAGVAHDFNNLLTIITGNLELIRRDLGENQSITPMLDTVMKATGRGADLIRQMSAFNRKRPLQQRAMSPREAIDNLGRLIPRTLGETIQVHTHVVPEVWDLLSDPAQLESALLNMAINARDAMPNGGKLNLSARNVTLEPGDSQGGPGDFVLFTVEDTGSGIPPELMDKIFEPFFTTKEQGKGTGLGLSMVFGFVQQCGGHMRVYSEVGIGTTFRLYFPRYVKGQAAKPEPAAPQAPKAAPLPRAQGPVLIVEDQEEIRLLAVSIFERMGYPTIVCADAHAGLAALQRNPGIALLFSDVTLPGGKSGADLAGDSLRLRPNVPVLLTSGFTEQAIDLNPLLKRGVLFLEKPYQLSDVQAKVLELLQRNTLRPN